ANQLTFTFIVNTQVFKYSLSDERLKTHCEHYRDSVKATSPDGNPITGVYVPQCDAEGQYLPQQCHGSTGYCWCVDSRGEERRAGTRTPPGAAPVDCDRPGETVPPQRFM
uniref:Thyroglobulin type-1 domain-containing protein n=1 Tax=Haplochromis burtoni TaxID=8153 RepID=A0A3Q2WC77_HAPBU